MVFKCKMCGGALEVKNGETVATCEYCGTTQTLPKLDDDKRANMYDRANHFRRNNEFDKAAGIYEQILNEDNTDAEAYWSLVLCRYGIEYVEDPSSHKRIPTVNRAQFTSVFDDDNYKSALRYADGFQRGVYEDEAKAINEIQKGILAISQKEEPFDVFICYKETDSSGRRTQDSVLAQDLYYQLKQEGFKVFFSRITLEDKLGSAYEPYIFAALNSAKVMVVLGTKAEYFNAVWVKNEWSRYLALIRNGAKKMLIPAYRDMNPYDLPEEFSHLQAQDMSKLGFMQDLIRGIKKIVQAEMPKAAVVKETVVSVGNANVAALLKRAFMFLEDGDWNSADEYCEKVLDADPENAEAYLGKLMAEFKVRRREDLQNLEQLFNSSNNYQKAVRFGSEKLKAELNGYIACVKERAENARLTGIYNSALAAMNGAKTESTFKAAAVSFKKVSGFKNADELAEVCLQKAEVCRKDEIYFAANGTHYYEYAIKLFESIIDWKDSEERIRVCKQRIEKRKADEEAYRINAEKAAKRRKKVSAITASALAVCIVFIILLVNVFIPNGKYNAAIKLISNGKYVEAYESLIALNGYKDSKDKASGIFGKYKEEKMKSAEVGDEVFFGLYEQDNDTSNGKEDIEWTVLDKNGKSLFLISKYALDCQQYNSSYSSVTWESCFLRKWLNGTFLNNAFTAEEQSLIKNTSVSADNNPKYSTNPGNATTDKVFLLSITEAEKYFASDSARQCEPTKYAIAKGARKGSSGNCWWWLRSLGNIQTYAAYVRSDGSINYLGYNVNYSDDSVRPALWITLDF